MLIIFFLRLLGNSFQKQLSLSVYPCYTVHAEHSLDGFLLFCVLNGDVMDLPDDALFKKVLNCCKELLRNDEEAKEATQKVLDKLKNPASSNFDLALKNVCVEWLYKKYFPKIFEYCHKFSFDDREAEDAAQDALINYYKTYESGKLPPQIKSLSNYLKYIARNLCYNKIRDYYLRQKLQYRVAKKIFPKQFKVEKGEREPSLNDLNYDPKKNSIFTLDGSYDSGNEEKINDGMIVRSILMDFFNNKRKNRKDESKDTLVVSICFKYYLDKMSLEEIAREKRISDEEANEMFDKRHEIFMYHFDDLTLGEIAERKGISIEGVRKRLLVFNEFARKGGYKYK